MARAALAGSLAAAAAPARASDGDWGCQVLLCLSTPGGPTQYAACVPPIERLWAHLARRGAFPVCTQGGVQTSLPGYDPYEPCAAGYGLRVVDGGEATASGPACVSLTPVRSCPDAPGETCQPYEVRPAVPRAKPRFVDVTTGGPTTRIWF